jgi:hypothetical protein
VKRLRCRPIELLMETVKGHEPDKEGEPASSRPTLSVHTLAGTVPRMRGEGPCR